MNLKIAKVLKPQGLKGEIKVECFSSDLSLFLSLKKFKIENKIYNVTSIRIQNKFAFIKTKEILSFEEAEALRGKILIIEKEDNRPKKDFEFFIQDLEGCKVEDENGKLIGFIDSIEKYGSADIINLMLGGAIKSFPFLKNVFKEIDIDNKKIIVFSDKLEEVLV